MRLGSGGGGGPRPEEGLLHRTEDQRVLKERNRVLNWLLGSDRITDDSARECKNKTSGAKMVA